MKKVLGLLAVMFVMFFVVPARAATADDVQSVIQTLHPDPEIPNTSLLYRNVTITSGGKSVGIRLEYDPEDGYGLTATPDLGVFGCLIVDDNLDGTVDYVTNMYNSIDKRCVPMFNSVGGSQTLYALAIQEARKTEK